MARNACVAEYFPDKRPRARHDPRKHAVALGYVVKLTGSITPMGEAVDFRWFAANELPPDDEIGFDQAAVISELASSLTVDYLRTHRALDRGGARCCGFGRRIARRD